MKTTITLFMICSFMIMVLTDCKKKSDSSGSPTVNVNNTVAKMGNHWSGVDNNTNHLTVDVVSNNNGKATVNVKLAGSNTVYPYSGYCSETEIDDYFYSNGDQNSPYPMIKFNAKVGDEYDFNYGNYKITRVVESLNDMLTIPGIGKNLSCFRVKETIPKGTLYGSTPAYVNQIIWYFSKHYGVVEAVLTPSFGNPVNDTVFADSTNIAAK